MKNKFLNSVKNHKMEILLNNGLYRHLVFSDGTLYFKFEIITYPNYLIICGDMGTYSFSRSDDMFCFFGQDDLNINTGYWYEKMVSDSTYIKAKVWSSEHFKDNVMEYYENWKKDLNEEDAKDLKDMVDDLLYVATNEYDAISAINNWDYPKFPLDNFWECSCMKKTYHFIWCLYAIVWAIQQYDKIQKVKDFNYKVIYEKNPFIEKIIKNLFLKRDRLNIELTGALNNAEDNEIEKKLSILKNYDIPNEEDIQKFLNIIPGKNYQNIADALNYKLHDLSIFKNKEKTGSGDIDFL